jgi:hypothetical protein
MRGEPRLFASNLELIRSAAKPCQKVVSKRIIWERLKEKIKQELQPKVIIVKKGGWGEVVGAFTKSLRHDI